VNPSACRQCLQLNFDDLLKQQTAVTFDVIEVKNPRTPTPKQFFQHRLTLDQWQCPQVFAVEV
jgi:hypothetical protein